MDKDTYFNFPISLIDGIFTDKMKVLNNIFEYSIYAKAIILENNTMEGKIKAAMKYFKVTGNVGNGKYLYENTPATPITNIKLDLFWDFYKNYKTEFEIAVLCGFLAIRSILLFKSYCKVTDNYMLVRMAGRASIKEIENLPEPLKKYLHRYHLEKIKKELKLNWNLKMYGRHTRGFYVSFGKELTDLIYEAEKKRRKYIEKNYQNEFAEARKQALRKLYEPAAVAAEEAAIKRNLEKIKEVKNGIYPLNRTTQQDIEAIKHIIEKKLLPETDLTLSADFKELTIKKNSLPF